MNHITIAIMINDRRVLLAAQWPTLATLAHQVKRKVRHIAHRMAMAIIPLPVAAMA